MISGLFLDEAMLGSLGTFIHGEMRRVHAEHGRSCFWQRSRLVLLIVLH